MTHPIHPKKLSPADRTRLHRMMVQMATVSGEALNLYRPLPHIEKFHACRAPERILRGSNRAGKTLGAAVEISRAVTGQDPFGKYPTENGRCFIVGKDGKHNSETLYRKLFRWGAMKVVPDEETGLWRALRPWDPRDADREHEAKLAPPLIPDRMVKETSWENKKESLPNLIRMKNGWEIRFFSSLAKPPQGADIDLAWFDEEICDEEWYPEISARLLDRSGKFVWSATAQLGGYQLYELCMMAEKEFMEHGENARIVEFLAHLNDNPHITQEMKDLFFAKLTPEQRAVRIDMEFQFTAQRVYPEYSWRVHGIDWFEIPDDWTRYMVVDPGRQVCAVLFAAVPSPRHELDGHIVLYDELYIRNCDTRKFAKAVREKAHGQNFRDFIIDHRGGRVRHMDSGGTQEEQLGEALRKVKVRSQLSKYGFTWGSDDVDAGIQAARTLLVDKARDGRPILLVMRDKLPYFQWEIDRYHYRKEKTIVTDKPEQRHSHLMDCFRYLAMYEPGWHRPPRKISRSIYRIVQAKRKKQLQKDGPPGITLGPVSH